MLFYLMNLIPGVLYREAPADLLSVYQYNSFIDVELFSLIYFYLHISVFIEFKILL